MRSAFASLHAARTVLVLSCLSAFALTSCGKDTPDPVKPHTVNVTDFALTDLNAASPLAGQPVSPHQFTGKISAWYFGHAT